MKKQRFPSGVKGENRVKVRVNTGLMSDDKKHDLNADVAQYLV